MARPNALGLDVSIESLDDADLILAELSHLSGEQARRKAALDQRIATLKTESDAAATVEVEGQTLTLAERTATLIDTLGPWLLAHVGEHLPPKKKSLELLHGTIGLRQQPAVAQFGEDVTEQWVLDQIEEATGLITAVNAILDRKIPTLGKSVTGRDVLKLEVVPALKPMLSAVDSKRLTTEQLAAFGVFLRAPYDEPVIKPSKLALSSAL